MDSYNRHFGTEQKYGFFHTDFLSEKKDVSIKRSGQWLQKFIKNRNFNPETKDILFGRFEKEFMFGAGTSAFQEKFKKSLITFVLLTFLLNPRRPI